MRNNLLSGAMPYLRQQAQAFAYPLFSTAVFYLAFTVTLPYLHGLYGIGLLSLDFVLQLLLGLLLFQLSRNKLIFVLLQACLMALLYLSTPLKVAYFAGGPVTPYDFASMGALLHIVDPATRWLILAPLIGLCGLFLYNLRLTRHMAVGMLITFTLLPLGLQAASPSLAAWLDQAYPTQPWRQGFNYAVRGPSIYLLHQTVKILGEENRIPPHSEVADAVAELESAPTGHGAQPTAKPRNLHLLMVESLWDAHRLPSLAQSPDPFAPAFRQLWELGGGSAVLSPVYGAGTANAEFELLCGLPILDDKIVFEHEIRNAALPCLPRLLQRHGYRTTAFHPNHKDFWNRAFAYPRLGFGEYFSLDSFTLDELLGGRYLSDRSFLRQVRNTLEKSDTPLFDYSITIAEHEPYYSEPTWPTSGSWNSGNEELDRYLTLIHESTDAIAEHVALMRRRDPDGLIVILGDHSPLLGPNFEGYRDAGLMNETNGDIDAGIQRRIATTPLIVIDGRNGPQRLGELNLYELPSLLLRLLDLPDTMPPHGNRQTEWRYRPMAGLGMLVWNKVGQTHRCENSVAAPPCLGVDRWREAANTLRLDLLRGEQHLSTLIR